MRYLHLPFLLLIILGAASATAEPRVITPSAPPSIEWDNSRPEQRQALDHFYQSLQQQQLQDSLGQRELRQQHIEQLRDMTPEQRQQQILNFVQQRQQQLLLPTP